MTWPVPYITRKKLRKAQEIYNILYELSAIFSSWVNEHVRHKGRHRIIIEIKIIFKNREKYNTLKNTNVITGNGAGEIDFKILHGFVGTNSFGFQWR